MIFEKSTLSDASEMCGTKTFVVSVPYETTSVFAKSWCLFAMLHPDCNASSKSLIAVKPKR